MSDVRVARSLDEVPVDQSVVTIGVFDGVHRGHATLIAKAVDEARERGLRSVVVTFDRHPLEVLRPGEQPKYLQTLNNKITALLAEKVDLVYVVPFSMRFSRQSPDEFIEQTLAGPIGARKVIIGANFHFGRDAEGDVPYLVRRGQELGFEVDGVTLVQESAVNISSTEIRRRIGEGEVEWAARALGRPHVLEGPIVKGFERGRTLGFPTANVEVDDRMQMPALGVYAGHAVVLGGDGKLWPMVVNLGRRPTFGGEDVTVEAHLIGADMDMYGDHLAVSFEHRLRDEQKFDGVDALVAQIGADVEEGRRRLGLDGE